MPIDREFDPDHSIWCITIAESFSLDDILELLEKNTWGDSNRYLWDLRDLREGPGSSAEVRDAATAVERTQQLWAGGRAAILVSRNLDFGIARMFQTYAEDINVRYEIFRERDAAIAWLVGEDED